MILINQIPKKSLFKVQEVCELCQIKPYVLRFWDSEFDQIQSVVNSSGKKLYQKKDILIISVLKDLLFDRKLTIEKARHELSMVDFEKVIEDQLHDSIEILNEELLEDSITGDLAQDLTFSNDTTENFISSVDKSPRVNLQPSIETLEKINIAKEKLKLTLNQISEIKYKYGWP